MSALTLEQWRERLADYIASEKRILESQEYAVGQGGTARRNRRADLDAVQTGIRECNAEIAKLETAATPRTRRVFTLRPY